MEQAIRTFTLINFDMIKIKGYIFALLAKNFITTGTERRKIKASLATNTEIMKPVKIVNVRHDVPKAKKVGQYAAMWIRIF